MPPSESVRPYEIRKVGPDEILVLWNDDHRSLFHARFLRLNCPCAGCVDEWTGQRTVRPEHIPESTVVSGWQPVGNYGVRFTWTDGHDTGIFSFQALRQLCRCSPCLGIHESGKCDHKH